MLGDSTVALTNGASSHMDATNALTVDEIAAQRAAAEPEPQLDFSVA